MRKIKTYPKDGEPRIRFRFLWWPLTLAYVPDDEGRHQTETRWLVFVWVKERFEKHTYIPDKWEPVAFVDHRYFSERAG